VSIHKVFFSHEFHEFARIKLVKISVIRGRIFLFFDFVDGH